MNPELMNLIRWKTLNDTNLVKLELRNIYIPEVVSKSYIHPEGCDISNKSSISLHKLSKISLISSHSFSKKSAIMQSNERIKFYTSSRTFINPSKYPYPIFHTFRIQSFTSKKSLVCKIYYYHTESK
jgi:hypothetical protein